MNWLSKFFRRKSGETTATAEESDVLSDEDRGAVAARIKELTWGGFESKDGIREILEDFLYPHAWSARDLAWLQSQVDEEWEAKKTAENSWPAVTAYDRLNKVFQSLRAEGVLALHNAGNTQSDGWDDSRQFWDEAGGPSSGIDGAIFYHGQDVDRVTEDHTLLLTFGTFPGAKRNGMDIARLVAAALNEAGFDVVTPADESRRIEIQNIVWTKRSP